MPRQIGWNEQRKAPRNIKLTFQKKFESFFVIGKLFALNSSKTIFFSFIPVEKMFVLKTKRLETIWWNIKEIEKE